MPARFYTINDPELSEWIFHSMRMASPQSKMALSANELKYFEDEESIRRFAEHETLDKRLLMMLRLGYSWALISWPQTVDIQETLAPIAGQYQLANKRLAIIEAMAKNKVFVLSSRDLTIIAHMAAQNSHSQVYTLDYTYLKLRDKLSNYRIRPFTEEIRDSVKEADEMSKILLNSLITKEVFESICGCNEYEMKILLALFSLRQTMVSHDKIAELMHEPYRTQGIAKVCGVLCDKNYIAREPGYRKQHRSQNYMIMEAGITAVMNYIKYVVKHSM